MFGHDQGVTPTTPAGSYHHGDLPNALRAAGAELLAERGAGGFSLREVARRAGVSHAAPAHHFGDARGLITSIAVEAFRHLHAQLFAAIDGVEDPRTRLARAGRAYVELGTRHPGHCAVMFREDLVDTDDPELEEWSMKAYGVLVDTVTEFAARENPDLDVDQASRLCWSTMQGLLDLHPNMGRMAEKQGFAPVAEIGDVAESFAGLVVDGLTNSKE